MLRNAPEAFRARQLRAVTLADYVKRAEEVGGVSRAVARYAWTGSWRTVRIDGAEGAPADDALQTVFENGEIVRTQSFDEVRARAAGGVQRLADSFAL